MGIQCAPVSTEYCQAPCVSLLALLALMAMPASVLPSGSENLPDIRLETLAPGGLVVSSLTAASAGRLSPDPPIGESARGLTVTVMVLLAVAAAPPVWPRSLICTVMVSVAELVLFG